MGHNGSRGMTPEAPELVQLRAQAAERRSREADGRELA